MSFRVARASFEHLDSVNALIARAKASGGHAPDYLRAALPLLRVDETYLSENLCFEIREGEALRGFAAVSEERGEKILDHLWVDPEHHGRGAGRVALAAIRSLALKQGWPRLLVWPDPGARGFYEKAGFTDTGLRRPSRVTGGPEFAQYRKDLESDGVPARANSPPVVYSPPFYRETRPELIHRLIDETPFALLITDQDGAISHLPLLREGETLVGHMARANPQWRGLNEKPACRAVFPGPHAYVTSAWYAPRPDNVPTWNYAAVHVHARFEIISDPAAAFAAMERMVARFEARYGVGWALPQAEPALDALMKAIVVFRLMEPRYDAKFKLSQRQEPADRARVIEGLSRSGAEAARDLARWMREIPLANPAAEG